MTREDGVLLAAVPAFPLAVLGVVDDPRPAGLGPSVDLGVAQLVPRNIVEAAQQGRGFGYRLALVEGFLERVAGGIEGIIVRAAGEFLGFEGPTAADGCNGVHLGISLFLVWRYSRVNN